MVPQIDCCEANFRVKPLPIGGPIEGLRLEDP